ncbi:MAG: Trk family potassium uptake protein [Chloroflexi bacterium]|nr:MAG: Trk family potassium uptake protein [Chloroflexota bacterium]
MGPAWRARRITPPQLLAGVFLISLSLGTALFMLPQSSADGVGLPFIDALFMATSALCVTGLVVVDPGSDLSRFGQVVLAGLIQIGGIGFMVIASFMAILLGKRITIRERIILKEALNHHSVDGIVPLVVTIIVSSLAVQFVGGVLLSLFFAGDMAGDEALFRGFFHAISAYNNAGFDLFGNSLIGYQTHLGVQLTVLMLLITGGLGFFVLLNLIQERGVWRKLSLHSKLVLTTTLALIVVGSVLMYVGEYGGPAYAELTPFEQVMASVFNSSATRSAGMNTVPLPLLGQATQALFVVLMFIGSSPSSTGGGIKTITVATSYLMLVALFRGEREIQVYRRTIAKDLVVRAFVVIVLAATVVFVATFLLALFDRHDVFVLLFEVVSAFGTVGFSLGITAQLSTASKAILILVMSIGRLGPLTVFYALSQRNRPRSLHYPEENLMIG